MSQVKQSGARAESFFDGKGVTLKEDIMNALDAKLLAAPPAGAAPSADASAVPCSPRAAPSSGDKFEPSELVLAGGLVSQTLTGQVGRVCGQLGGRGQVEFLGVDGVKLTKPSSLLRDVGEAHDGLLEPDALAKHGTSAIPLLLAGIHVAQIYWEQ
ncbi:unnamed protein product [Prorocentrum cordatum]|uniref:Uncharacterized protein n=1 Tax=Prorocentrum cordatum TaxID=2364126 RepID=A0ABN9X2Z7_9DINO|nr:unnamed protein product [Polarella glacialis]